MTNATRFITILVVVLVGLAFPRNSPALTPGAIGAEAPAATGDWQITTFPSQTIHGTYSSMALDQGGNPHISSLDETSYDVKYVRRDGDKWEERTVDTLTFLAWSNTSLALNGAGQPQIAYPYANPFRIGHAQWDGTQWQLVKIDTGGCPSYVTLALDGTGEPCISYYQWEALGGARIWLICHEATGWQTASVVDTVHYSSLQELALYHSLVLQSDGTPHLSYYRQILDDPAQLWYATRSGGGWVRTMVDEGPGVGSYSSLALDSQNRPHISYYDHTNGDLKYARWDGSQWHIETVDSEGNTGGYTSLKLDKNDHPHISYYDGRLRYARWDGSQWLEETVDSTGDVGRYTSLGLDGDGNVHISYYDSTNGNLKYATNSVGGEYFIYLPLVVKE